jgi:MFS family permease
MLTNYRHTIRLLSRDARLLLLTVIVVGFSYMGVYVTLFNLYLLRLGYGPVFIGQINAAAQLGFALFSLPAGVLGSRWGSRNMAAAGLGVTVLSLGLLPLAEFLPTTWQTGWLMTTFITTWLGGALYLVNNYPLLMSVTGPAERQHAFSIRQALTPLGSFAGSLASGFLPGLLAMAMGLSLDQPAPYRYALFSAAGVLVPGIIALLAIRDSQPQQRQKQLQKTEPLPAGLIAFMAGLMLLEVAAYSTASTFFNVFLDNHHHLPTPWIGGLRAAGDLLAVPMALVMPIAVAQWGKRQTILVGVWSLGSSLLLLAFVPHWGVAGLGFIGVSAAYAFLTPALILCQQEIIPSEWRATMSGAVIMGRGLGTATMAWSGGYLISHFGYPSLFLTGATLAILGAILFWAYTWAPRWLLTRQIGGPTR